MRRERGDNIIGMGCPCPPGDILKKRHHRLCSVVVHRGQPCCTVTLTRASNGAAGAIGGAVGAEASRLMRERLGSSPEGRVALDPGSGDSGEMERQVAAALAADPEFARRFEQLYEATRRHTTGAPHAGRNLYRLRSATAPRTTLSRSAR